MREQRAIDQLVEDVMRGGVSRRSFLKRAAALGLAAPTITTLLAACGDDEAETPGAATTTTSETPGTGADATATTDTAAPDATETPADSGSTDGAAPSGQIVIMQGVDANTLDPLFRNATPEFTVNIHVFDMMLTRNSETLEITPGIIQEWTNVDDLTWEFKLVEGATFHNGDPVNAWHDRRQRHRAVAGRSDRI
jgi:peptide/nickel transport system substrate-binding protein